MLPTRFPLYINVTCILCLQNDERLFLIAAAFPSSGGGSDRGVHEKQENGSEQELRPWTGSVQCM